jgi:ankyrin repeat protein
MLTKLLSAVLLLSLPPSTAGAEDLNEELLAAARRSDVAAVKALLAKGADANAKSSYDVTAISFAADRGSLEIVQTLLEHGADVNAKDNFYKETPKVTPKSSGHCWKKAPLELIEPSSGQSMRIMPKWSKPFLKKGR